MFKDGNFIGVLLVGLCLISAGIMIWVMVFDKTLTYTGPNWLPWLLMIFFLGGSFWGVAQRFRGGGDHAGTGTNWPNPTSGRRSLLDRLRGKGNDSRQ